MICQSLYYQYILDKYNFLKSPKTFRVIITIILCCPCYMPKYVPRLEGMMHDLEGECIIIIFFRCHTFDRQGPHFCNSVDCFIKSPTSAKSSEFAFSKKIILFNGISSIKSGLFNIILLNKLFLR